MRYSPSRAYLVMERGQYPTDGRIEVCRADTGAVLATFGCGHNPRWWTAEAIVAESPDGIHRSERHSGFHVEYIPANRGQLDANGHHIWAVSDLRTTRVHQEFFVGPTIANAREPRQSIGELAVRHPDTGILRLYNSGAELGLCEDARWSSDTLVWWLAGRVWGRTTPDQPTVELTVPGRACAHPCPFWDGSRLWVGLVLDDGELWVAEWGSLVRREALGWPVGRSDGSGFDWDITARPGGVLTVAYFDPHGAPVYVDIATASPPQSMAKPPAIDPWELVPDGTLVTDAFRWMFGEQPSTSPDGKRICLHKNVNEQEWRELIADVSGTEYVAHLFDRSRYPGDEGWYLWSPDQVPTWAKDRFKSAEHLNFEGEIIEYADGRRNRWVHRNTLYGLKAGGVLVQFDPRFPRQDYGPEKCYERFFNSATHARWELWYTPDTPEARALPWGDRSLDVMKAAVQSPVVPTTPLPYIECPRMSVTDDPWAPPPPDPDQPMTIEMSEAVARAGYPAPADIVQGALMRFRNEVILERDKIEPDSMTAGAQRYFFQYYSPEMAEQQVQGGVPGSADGWGHYSEQAFQAAKAAYEREQNPQ